MSSIASATAPPAILVESSKRDESNTSLLSPKDIDVIRNLDSRSFGFLNLTSENPTSTTDHVNGLLSSVSKDMIRKGILVLQSELNKDNCTNSSNVHNTICQIGHLHLLLEQYQEALSAYQSYSQLNPDSSQNTSFLYGLALIYFAYGQYSWSLLAFQKILLHSQTFTPLSEIHIRMGIIYKEKDELKKAVDCFCHAYSSSGPCSISKLQIQFHIGNIYFLRGVYNHAKHCFETILSTKCIPNKLKALTQRQLGWLYHTAPQVATSKTNTSQSKAIELLKLAVDTDPSCGQSWYYLGRCYISQGMYKEGFIAYRQSITAEGNQPDTWCAIGILYQQMGQARDSLQAYITAVYLNINHTATWTDMGLLYESCGHLVDSLLCYKNGLASVEKKPRKNLKHGPDGVTETLFSRHSFVEHHIQQTGGTALHSSHSRPTLLSLQEAWSTLVPHDLRVHHPQSETPIFTLPLSPVQSNVHPSPPPYPLVSPGLSIASSNSKRNKVHKSKDPIIMKNITEGWIGNHQISASPLQAHSPTLFSLNSPAGMSNISTCYNNQQLDQPILPTTPVDTSQTYENPIMYYPNTPQYNISEQLYTGNHRATIESLIPKLPHTQDPLHPYFSPVQTPHSANSISTFGSTSNSLSGTPNAFPFPSSFSPLNPHPHPIGDHFNHQTLENKPNNLLTPLKVLGKRSHTGNSFFSETKSPKMIATSPTPLLMGGDEHQILTDVSSPMTDNSRPSSLFLPTNMHATSSNHKTQCHPHFGTGSIYPHSHSSGINMGSGHLSDTSSGISSSSAKFSASSDRSSTSSSPRFVSSPFFYPSPNFREVPIKLIHPSYQPHSGLASEDEYMKENPLRPPRGPPSPVVEPLELHPEVPVYTIKSDFYDDQDLQYFCTNSDNVPICIIKGLPAATNFDLSLFSSDTLMRDYGDHEVEVREQILQPADKNYDTLGKKQIWKCESNRSLTTVKEYGEYQRECLKEEKETDLLEMMPRKMLKFGTNCDLSDEERWNLQLSEITKLPKFLQVNCREANFLNHVGHTVLGMNTVQLYMKVPGCRTPGHQENNNFCSVNVNIGPGDCEWFAVPNKYWGKIHELCEKHKISFLVGSWWPILEELEQHHIPVYRFTQYKGETVWINPGTVHWVQANSCCNNIAWNVGPMTAHQLRMSWERYQWNKMLKVRSIVPMMTLIWNFAKKVKVFNVNLFHQISSLLLSSYKQCEQLLQLLETLDISVTWHGHVEGESTPTCTTCLEEVFNILFVSTNKKGEHLVYCHKCIQQLSSKNKKQPFTVLQQYTLTELKQILDKFQPKYQIVS